MSRHHPSHRKRNTSPKEFYSYKRTSPHKIGAKAVHAGIIVSKPGHSIGLQKSPLSPYDNPQDVTRIEPEILASDILSTFDTLDSSEELTSRQLGKQLLDSIDKDSDPETIIALKQLGAKICGIEKNNTDYQHVIATLDTVMTADDLRDFITYIHEWSHPGAEDTEQYVNNHMNELSGFRVEASFPRLAEAAGFSYRSATRYEDHHGLDFMVEGVPFDLKSSAQKAKHHVKRHENDTNRIDAVRFVPPITSEDFDGRLVIPYEKVKTIVETTNFTAMVTEAIQKYRNTHRTASVA